MKSLLTVFGYKYEVADYSTSNNCVFISVISIFGRHGDRTIWMGKIPKSVLQVDYRDILGTVAV